MTGTLWIEMLLTAEASGLPSKEFAECMLFFDNKKHGPKMFTYSENSFQRSFFFGLNANKIKKMIYLQISAILAAYYFLPTNGYAQAIPPIVNGTPYGNVRVALIKEGWKPVTQAQQSHDFMSQGLKQRGWFEVKECAGTGRAPCIFIWQNRQGRELEVLTTGESPKFSAFR